MSSEYANAYRMDISRDLHFLLREKSSSKTLLDLLEGYYFFEAELEDFRPSTRWRTYSWLYNRWQAYGLDEVQITTKIKRRFDGYSLNPTLKNSTEQGLEDIQNSMYPQNRIEFVERRDFSPAWTSVALLDSKPLEGKPLEAAEETEAQPNIESRKGNDETRAGDTKAGTVGRLNDCRAARLIALDRAWLKIESAAKEKGISLNRNEIPGRKKDFCRLVKHLERELLCIMDGTLDSEYFHGRYTFSGTRTSPWMDLFPEAWKK